MGHLKPIVYKELESEICKLRVEFRLTGNKICYKMLVYEINGLRIPEEVLILKEWTKKIATNQMVDLKQFAEKVIKEFSVVSNRSEEVITFGSDDLEDSIKIIRRDVSEMDDLGEEDDFREKYEQILIDTPYECYQFFMNKHEENRHEKFVQERMSMYSMYYDGYGVQRNYVGEFIYHYGKLYSVE